MGTSASNNGPKGSPPLLPNWYNDSPPVPQPEPSEQGEPSPENAPEQEPNLNQPNDFPPANQPTTDWGKAKGALTRVSNQTGGSSSRKAGNKYVRSLGGSRGATKAAAQGVRIGSRYASFLGTIASSGINGALSTLGLDTFIGRSSEEICAAIANALAPVGATNDEAIARDALITTLDALYSKILDDGGDINSLNDLTPDLVKETMIEYVSNFVFTKWMYELGNAIEKGSISESEAITLEHEVKDLITQETVEHYRDVSIQQFNLNDSNSLQVITDIFETAYSILES